MGDKKLARCVAIDDVRQLARERLPPPIYDTLAGGSGDEVTATRNITDFERYALLPRFARDISQINTETHILGTKLGFPLILAPTGTQGIIHPEAELVAARAAASKNIMYALPTFSTASIEEVAQACDGPKIFQLYALQDHAFTEEMIQRAKNAGYDALCLTIDVPVIAGLERVKRWGLNAAGGMPPLRTVLAMAKSPRWLWRRRKIIKDPLPDIAKQLRTRGTAIGSDFYETIVRRDLTWSNIAGIARFWDGPFAVKGILSPDDAHKAVDSGATAIVVCNHGGTSLDRSPSSISVLPEIVDAVGRNAEIIHAGGIRRGTEMAIAGGLGADAVMVGRPFLYGLAAGGQPGVEKVIDTLRTEFETSMQLCGCTTPVELRNNIVRHLQK